jgi:hypothetical protein
LSWVPFQPSFSLTAENRLGRKELKKYGGLISTLFIGESFFLYVCHTKTLKDARLALGNGNESIQRK